MKGRIAIIFISLLLGFLVWVLDALIDVFIIGDGTLSDQLFFISSHDFHLRSLILFTFLFAGISVSEISVKYKEAEKKVYKKEQDLSILYSTVSIAVDSLDFDAFLSDILNELISYMGADHGQIYLLDNNSGEAIMHASFGIPQDHSMLSISSDNPLIASLRQVTHLRKHISQPFVVSSGLCMWPKSNIDNCIAFPLISRNELIGFFLITSKDQAQLNDEDLHVLESVAKNVGMTIENMQLLEESNRACDELKLMDKMKDEFLSNITHELKTPLISIKGYSEIMYEGMFGELDPKQKDALKVIISNSERLHGLIESLLHMNTFHFEKEQVFSPVLLTDIIQGSINTLSLKLEAKHTRLKYNFNFGKDLHLVYGNADFLKQLFVYLLDNAIKFSSEFSEVEMSAYKEDEMLHVELHDHGIGIPQAHMDKIYNRFYQADGSMTRSYGGNGLGLFLAKNIVDMHKGKIWLESTEGIGTKVHVLIPLYESTIHSKY